MSDNNGHRWVGTSAEMAHCANCGIRQHMEHSMWPCPKQCTCETQPIEECPEHGIAASNHRQSEFYRKAGGRE